MSFTDFAPRRTSGRARGKEANNFFSALDGIFGPTTFGNTFSGASNDIRNLGAEPLTQSDDADDDAEEDGAQSTPPAPPPPPVPASFSASVPIDSSAGGGADFGVPDADEFGDLSDIDFSIDAETVASTALGTIGGSVIGGPLGLAFSPIVDFGFDAALGRGFASDNAVGNAIESAANSVADALGLSTTPSDLGLTGQDFSDVTIDLDGVASIGDFGGEPDVDPGEGADVEPGPGNDTGAGSVEEPGIAGFGDNGASPDGGDGGDVCVICTELHRRGLMSRELYRADQMFASSVPRHTLNGYHAWGVPYVRLMRHKHLGKAATAFIRPWALWWAGQHTGLQPSIMGRLLQVLGEPVCGMIGRLSGGTDFMKLYRGGTDA